MFDLQVLAFVTEVTRVSSFKMGRDVSARVFPESGVTTPFHALSHHGDKSDDDRGIRQAERYHVGIVAYFLDKLKNTPDGDGNLLDHSMVIYGSPMADGNVPRRTSGCRCSSPATPTARSKATCTSRRRRARRWRTSC